MSVHNSDYRDEFRNLEIGKHYSGQLHFWFTTLASLALIGICLAQLDTITAVEWWIIPITFIYANLAEYWGHRGPMHHPVRGLKIVYKRHSKQHHRFFTHQRMTFDSSKDYKAVLFPPAMIVFFIGVFAVPFWLLLTMLWSSNAAWLAVATAVAYFLNYEWLHFAYHCPEDSWIMRLPGLNKLRGLHQNHHNPKLMTRHNFNITYPIGDILFRTLYREQRGGD